jgi:Leucine-rich repeat (LRR) protein
MTFLEILGLGGNQLHEFTPGILKLKKLKELDLAHNQLIDYYVRFKTQNRPSGEM